MLLAGSQEQPGKEKLGVFADSGQVQLYAASPKTYRCIQQPSPDDNGTCKSSEYKAHDVTDHYGQFATGK